MDRTKPPERAVRSLTLFAGGDDRSWYTVSADVLASGDLRLLRANSGWFVALYANEFMDRWLWWRVVDHADLSALVEPGTDVLDAVRAVVLEPEPPATVEEAEARFHAWLDSRNVPTTRYEYDEYPD